MLADGLIEAAAERPDTKLDDERRRYYRLTDFGLRVLRAEAQRLEQIVSIVQSKRILSNPEKIGGV
jgi:DNA-binding PadR family transcriptional regulator